MTAEDVKLMTTAVRAEFGSDMRRVHEEGDRVLFFTGKQVVLAVLNGNGSIGLYTFHKAIRPEEKR